MKPEKNEAKKSWIGTSEDWLPTLVAKETFAEMRAENPVAS